MVATNYHPQPSTPGGGPEHGREIIPTDLHKAYQLPAEPVEIWETAFGDGWSGYTLAGGRALCVMETISADWPSQVVLAVLGRIVANLVQHCPVCRARPRLGAGEYHGRPVDGFMVHESQCPLSDPGLADLMAAGGDPPGAMPDLPRYWVAWIPTLKAGYRPRRGLVA